MSYMSDTGGNDQQFQIQFHVCYNLEHVKKMLWEDHESLFLTVDGRPATREEILENVKNAVAKGYTVLPPCDNINETGHCKGHRYRKSTIDIIIKCPVCGLNLSIWDELYYTDTGDGDGDGDILKDSETEYECPNGCQYSNEQIEVIEKQIQDGMGLKCT